MKSLIRLSALLLIAVSLNATTDKDQPPPTLELTRPVRSWEFLSATGTRAGIFGNESGRVEAWVYPLKIFRDFRLRFHTEDRVLDAASLARTVIVRPEATTILYTSDTFSVRETFLRPRKRIRRLHLFRNPDRIPSRNRSRLPSRFSTRMARRPRRHLRQLGQNAQRLPLR